MKSYVEFDEMYQQFSQRQKSKTQAILEVFLGKMVIKNIKKWIITQSKVGLSSIQNLYQFILLLFRYIWKKRIFEAAQALTLVSILSLVPIFAIFFSVLGMITNRESVRVELEAYITQFFIPKYGEIIF